MTETNFSCGMMREGQTELSSPLKELMQEHPPLLEMMALLRKQAERLEHEESIRLGEEFVALAKGVRSFIVKLEKHSGKEDDGLFPLMARYIGREVGPIAVMEYEHEQAKLNLRSFMEAAEKAEITADRLDAQTVKGISAYYLQADTILNAHFAKEESVLFPMAESMLSAEEKEELTRIMENKEAELTGEEIVGELVAEYPDTSNVFKANRIDFCCGGDRSILTAAEQKGIKASELLGELQQAIRKTLQGNGSREDWTLVPSVELMAHIIGTHHQYLRDELPVLSDFTTKIMRVHGPNHPELVEVNQLFQALKAELSEHIAKEEAELFPLIEQYEAELSEEHKRKIREENRKAEAEHTHAGGLLEGIRQATGDYQLPEDACKTYTLAFRKLEQLENDLFQHIHLENNILFPRYDK